MQFLAPVEYTVAVEAYLDQAALSRASRRVYQISLAGWAWPLVGKPLPPGRERRGATAPLVPLALLDDLSARTRLAGAFAERTATAGPRTANRELSALRSAAGWWLEQEWIRADPVAGLRHRPLGAVAAPAALSRAQVEVLFRVSASLREQALWRLLHDSGAGAGEILALDAGQLDLARHRTRPVAGLEWGPGTGQLLHWLLAGRTWGPVFVTGRRVPPARGGPDRWRVAGQGRMSYRRAAEIFTAATRPLDPNGQGWTLHQLSAAGRDRR